MALYNTYFLIIPYVTVIIYFFMYKRDNFFLKIRSSVQLLLILILLGLVFCNVLIWKGFFEDYTFLKFDIENTDTQFKTTALVTVLAAIAAVFGWIFTSRVQIINTTRSHSVQVLMNSRNSTIYINKVDEATILRRKLNNGALLTNYLLEKKIKKKQFNKYFKQPINLNVPFQNAIQKNKRKSLEIQLFLSLNHSEKSSITYLLNFLEFVAIGIRHNNLDEDLIKGSFKSILKANHLIFKPVINHLRKNDSQKTYNQLEMLHKRWDDEDHAKCIECRSWFKVTSKNTRCRIALNVILHMILSVITCFFWILMIGVMKIIELLSANKAEEKYVCPSCSKTN